MLISYPVLGASQVRESDFGGRYPVAVFKDSMHEGLTSGWHGGLHLTVNGTSTTGPVVRAIADGTVVAYRVPTKKPEKNDELEKHALNYGGSWTDDGFVLLKHEKECGENKPVVFYSLYMHLKDVVHDDLKGLNNGPGKSTPNPKKQIKEKGKVIEASITLKRKEALGHAGSIEGQPNQIHFEIFTSDDDFKKFFPAQPSTNEPTPTGAMDPWGELYFRIPSGLPLHSRQLKPSECPATSAATPTDLLIAMSYHDGRIRYRAIDDNGCEWLQWEHPEQDAEYKLFALALSLGGGTQSRNYEAVRFGRYMDWSDLSSDPKPAITAHCWHPLPMFNGWVDLADAKVKRLSDADFPAWNWKRLEQGQAGFDPANGLCAASELLSAIDRNGDGHLADLEFTDWTRAAENKALLRQMIVRFQSEWDGRDLSRWDWVKTMWADPVKHELSALRRRMSWVKTQQQKAESAKPLLQQRVQKASDWLTKLEGQKAGAKDTLETALKQLEAAQKSRADFQNELKMKAPSTPKEKAANTGKLKALNGAVDGSTQAKTQAERCVLLLERAINQTHIWKTREEAKLQAAKDAISRADGMIVDLQKSMEASSRRVVAAETVKQADKDFTAYTAYMKALQWWTDGKETPLPGLPDSKVWHFHPLTFIEFFRKCHWLSKEELAAIFECAEERSEREKGKTSEVRSDCMTRREPYRVPLNRMMWKYGLVTPTRIAHSAGQSCVEATFLLSMLEGVVGWRRSSKHDCFQNETDGFYKDPDAYFTYPTLLRYDDKSDLMNKTKAVFRNAKNEVVEVNIELVKGVWKIKDKDTVRAKIDMAKSTAGDGLKFRGRGLKQLTGRGNYLKYGVYRGWVRLNDTDEKELRTGKMIDQHYDKYEMDDPERVGNDPWNCMDAGGWYMLTCPARPKKAPIPRQFTEGNISDQVIKKVTESINGGTNGLEDRKRETQRIYTLLNDEPVL